MDDICLSFPGKKEAKDGMARTKDIFAGGKMDLHKTRMTGDLIPEASVLGLVWDTVTDKLAVTVPQSSCPTTKSGLLSMVAKTFDPLGMLVPWLIGGKVLFQRTWKDMPNAGWDDSLLTRAWRHQRRVCEHLLRRWTSEYVAALRSWSVSPRGRPTRVPSVGDVVLVSGEGPRGRWPLALVTELIAGRDGKARAAFIKMNGKRTRRPLNKLYHLEATDTDATTK